MVRKLGMIKKLVVQSSRYFLHLFTLQCFLRYRGDAPHCTSRMLKRRDTLHIPTCCTTGDTYTVRSANLSRVSMATLSAAVGLVLLPAVAGGGWHGNGWHGNGCGVRLHSVR